MGLCRRTRQVVSGLVGRREQERSQILCDLTPKEYKQSMVYSDFYTAYQKVLEQAKHQAIGKASGLTNHVER